MKKEYKLKNYTTSISPEKTIAEIEQMLSQFGASHIVKEYDKNQNVSAVIFKLNNKNFKLPSKAEGVETLFRQNPQKYSAVSSKKYKEQALRTTWRMIKDWIHSQLSLVATQQAKIEEVMLPYMYDGKRTLFEAYEQGNLQIENQSLEVDK